MQIRGAWFGLAVFLWAFSSSPLFALLPFPLSPGQRGSVTCLENPTITYDVYLPTSYSTNSNPLPILYTFNPNGGGMVSHFQSVSSNLQIITIGVVSPRNGAAWDTVLRDCYAVARDVRNRVLFDPTAEMVSGFSGGGVVSYGASRFRPQHVTGVYAMAGWMGRGTISGHLAIDRVQTNLFVARSTGTSDTSAMHYLTHDSNYLASCGAVIKDLYFSGGHQVAPDSHKSAALSWILTNRVLAGANDRADAVTLAANWQARIAAGEKETVFRESVQTLINQPRSWFGYQAQLILDQLTADAVFREFDVASLATGDFANNQFYFSARGAALNGDLERYRACMKALTGITGVAGDRTGGIYSMLNSYGYRAPFLQCATGAGQIELLLTKDTPGLNYLLQTRSDLVGETWGELPTPVLNTNTIWSASLPIGTSNAFYRIQTTPQATSNPAWP